LRSKLVIRILILLLIVGSLYPAANILPKAHAAVVGTVCLADPAFNPTSGSSCPTSTSSFTGDNATSAGTQLRIAVNVNETNLSDILNGFDITVKADHTVLRPFGVDLTGSLIPAAGRIVLVECVGGTKVAGSACASTDTVDTIRLAATASNFFTTPPTVGLLFTAIFNIVANSTGSIPVTFQTGCSATSNTPNCVTIENGTTQAVPETLVTGTYTTPTAGVPYFITSTNATSLQLFAGVTNSRSASLTIVPKNGFSCFTLNCVDFEATAAATSGLTVSVSPPSISDGGTATLTVSATKFTAGGTHYVSLYTLVDPATANGLFIPANIGTFLNITVYITDFTLSSSVSSLTIVPAASATATVTLTSVSGFTGIVSLTAPVTGSGPIPSLPKTSFSLTSLLVKPGGTNSSTLTVAMNSTVISGTFTVTVTAKISALIHKAIITVSPSVPNIVITSFTMSTTSATVGQTITISVTLSNTGSITANFQLTAKYGTMTIGGPTNITLAAGATQTYDFTWNTGGYATGSDVVTATVSGGNVPTAVTSTPQTVALTAPSQPFLSGSLLYIIIGVIVAAIVAIALILLLRRRSKANVV
jgi:hypothetical protein